MVTTGVTARVQDYQALMACQAADGWLPEAHDQLASWLRNKKRWDVDVRTDGSHQDAGRELELLHHSDRQAQSFRARLVEPTPLGTWTTELIACDRRGDGDWISLTVHNDQGRFVDVPHLAKYLMQTLPLADGSLRFADKPQIFHAHQVEELVDLLCDQKRHGLVFVAGTSDSDLPFAPFANKVRDWTRQVYGLAQVIVLDPAATHSFTEHIGAPHSAHPWTIRTYLPGVDPATSFDARRHRYLTTASLADLSDGRVRKLLGTIARTHAAERPTPPALVRLRRTFERLENQGIVEAIARAEDRSINSRDHIVVSDVVQVEVLQRRAEPTAPEQDIAGGAAAYLSVIELVKATLGVDKLDEGTLRGIAASASLPRADPAAVERAAAQIRAQQARIEALEDDVTEMSKALEEEQLEHAVTTETLEKRNDEGRWLRRQLQEQGSYDVAFGVMPVDAETDYPESFSDLMERLIHISKIGVNFTGDAGHASSLDAVDSWGKCVHTAWDVVLTLGDYIRARRERKWEHGVDHYVLNTPPGYRQIAPGKFATTETATTMEQYGHKRVFPVPVEVDPGGRATMKAHFRLGQIGMVSPRLYFLDDYTRTGKIYIGYIGPHLTNTQTN